MNNNRLRRIQELNHDQIWTLTERQPQTNEFMDGFFLFIFHYVYIFVWVDDFDDMVSIRRM